MTTLHPLEPGTGLTLVGALKTGGPDKTGACTWETRGGLNRAQEREEVSPVVRGNRAPTKKREEL